MSWTEETKNDLRRYNQRKASIKHLEEELSIVNDKMHSISSGAADSVPIHGGGNRYEDKIINAIERKTRLEENLKEARHHVKKIDNGLSLLTEEQRAVLTVFYIKGYRGTAALMRLQDYLHFEKTKIYNIRTAALEELTAYLYGET